MLLSLLSTLSFHHFHCTFTRCVSSVDLLYLLFFFFGCFLVFLYFMGSSKLHVDLSICRVFYARGERMRVCVHSSSSGLFWLFGDRLSSLLFPSDFTIDTLMPPYSFAFETDHVAIYHQHHSRLGIASIHVKAEKRPSVRSFFIRPIYSVAIASISIASSLSPILYNTVE